MTISEGMKKYDGLRITHDNKWMVWDNVRGTWIIYIRKHYAKKTLELYDTHSEKLAMEILLK